MLSKLLGFFQSIALFGYVHTRKSAMQSLVSASSPLRMLPKKSMENRKTAAQYKDTATVPLFPRKRSILSASGIAQSPVGAVLIIASGITHLAAGSLSVPHFQKKGAKLTCAVVPLLLASAVLLGSLPMRSSVRTAAECTQQQPQYLAAPCGLR